MNNSKHLILRCQISFGKEDLVKLQKFMVNKKAANDEIIIFDSIDRSKDYSVKDIMIMFNISTRKEVEILIKNLELNQTTYSRIKNNELFYNIDAINRLNSYLKFRVAQ